MHLETTLSRYPGYKYCGRFSGLKIRLFIIFRYKVGFITTPICILSNIIRLYRHWTLFNKKYPFSKEKAKQKAVESTFKVAYCSLTGRYTENLKEIYLYEWVYNDPKDAMRNQDKKSLNNIIEIKRIINSHTCCIFEIQSTLYQNDMVVYDKIQDRTIHIAIYRKKEANHPKVIALLYEKYKHDVFRFFEAFSEPDPAFGIPPLPIGWSLKRDTECLYIYNEKSELIEVFPKNADKHPIQKPTFWERLGIKFFSLISKRFREQIKLLKIDMS